PSSAAVTVRCARRTRVGARLLEGARDHGSFWGPTPSAGATMKDYFSEQGPLQTSAPACPIVKSLKGQTALVTGANSGIGRAIAAALGSAGANVVVNYVAREDAARETLEEVQLCGGRAIAIAADVGNEQQVRAMFERTLGEFGSLDILVNNAGLQKDAPFHE